MSDNLFIVSKHANGRVIMDSVSHGERLQLVRGKDYEDARTKVNVPCYHHEGYGWFYDDGDRS